VACWKKLKLSHRRSFFCGGHASHPKGYWRCFFLHGRSPHSVAPVTTRLRLRQSSHFTSIARAPSAESSSGYSIRLDIHDLIKRATSSVQ